MDDYRFVHAADLHLDTPFSGIHADAPETAELLRDASLDAFDRLVEVALAREALFVVLAGDIYDGSERGLRAQLRFRDGLERLSEAGVRTFVAHGNHDPVEEGWQAIQAWPEHVTVFGSDEVGAVAVEDGGERLATVYGISYPTRAVHDNLARRFQRGQAPGLHVGVLHCTVGHQPDHDPYAPCTLDDLREARMDYWALGHVHKRQVLRRGQAPGDPWVVYAGNTQGRSPKPSERGAKGCYVVPVRRGGEDSPAGEPEFVALDAVRFAEVTADISGCEDVAQVTDALLEAADAAAADADDRALVLRGALRGRGPVHADLARHGALDDVLAALRDGARRRRPPVWWDALRDHSRAPLDRAALLERADFSGELVRLADALRADPGARAAVEAEARPILERLRPEPAAAPLDEVLDEAETRALDLLVEEG